MPLVDKTSQLELSSVELKKNISSLEIEVEKLRVEKKNSEKIISENKEELKQTLIENTKMNLKIDELSEIKEKNVEKIMKVNHKEK